MFKFIEGTDHKAIVTSDGRVFKRYSVNRRYPEKGFTGFREVKLSNDCSGYLQVGLGRIRNAAPVHRLVARAFIPNPENKPCIDHIDGDRTNNNLTNLRWVTIKENNNNPNTKYKHVYGSKCKVWINIQGFNPKSNHRTPIFTNLREASTWVTPEGKDIKPRTLVRYLNKKITYKNYFWTARLVTGEEYRKLLE